MNKRKIGIVVDSTCGSDYGKSFFDDVSVVPLTVMIDGKSYVDGTIDNETLLQAIDRKQKVTTSQPNPELFIQAFQQQLSLGYQHVICLTLSHKLSGAFNSACMAKKMLKDARIIIIDTNNIGPAACFVLKRIDYLLKQNPIIDVQELVNQLQKEQKQGFLLCNIESLKTLVHNGRISKFQAIIGNLLKIHPILKLQQNVLSIEKKVRNLKNCFTYFLKKIIEQKSIHKILDIQIVYVDDDTNAKKLLQQINDLQDQKIKVSIYGKISAVVAAHIGYKGFGFYLNKIND